MLDQYFIDVEDRKPQPALAMKARVKSKADLGAALASIYPEIAKFMEKKYIRTVGRPFCQFIKMTDEVIEVEAGIPLRQTLPGEDKIRSISLPGGQVVTTLHFGPYDTLFRAHDALRSWAQKNGKKLAPLPVEIYVSDPAQCTPEEIKTEVYYHLEP